MAGAIRPPEITVEHLEVVRLLVAAGATVEPEWMESEKVASRPAMLAAHRGVRE